MYIPFLLFVIVIVLVAIFFLRLKPRKISESSRLFAVERMMFVRRGKDGCGVASVFRAQSSRASRTRGKSLAIEIADALEASGFSILTVRPVSNPLTSKRSLSVTSTTRMTANNSPSYGEAGKRTSS